MLQKNLYDKQSLQPITVKERMLLDKQLRLANAMFNELDIKVNENAFESHRIEQAIAAWFRWDLANRFGIDVYMYSNALAAAWGCYLEQKYGFTWNIKPHGFGFQMVLWNKASNKKLLPVIAVGEAFRNKDFGLLSSIIRNV